ncbi:MAG: hypothetical protein IIC92_06570 [Chloroflexi bacterium]|nr:hypothetical protein [Chloroflexota bacterium]
MKRLSPAFVAYNVPDFAEFVVQRPLASPVTGAAVTHYTAPFSLRAKTSVIAAD